jgi:lipid-A-disaccharide synthase
LKKILISAGEASGDFYGAALTKEILKTPGASVIAFGGPMMKDAGAEIKIELTKYALTGFSEIAGRFLEVAGVFLNAVRILKKERPDVLVVIDYPGFNMRLIKEARKAGIKKIVYYITPQVWVWKYKRIFAIKKYTDLCIVVLPFEKGIFEKVGANVRYYGHPMAEFINSLPASPQGGSAKTVGVFPGSRENEIRRFFDDILEACMIIKEKNKDAKFVLFRSGEIDMNLINEKISKFKGLEFEFRNSGDYAARKGLTAAIAKSGTTTLELGLLGIPMAVVYRVSRLSYMIMLRLIKNSFVKYISLPNIILGKEAVKEFVQNDFNPEALAKEIGRLLNDREYAGMVRVSLSELNGFLAAGGGTSAKIAQAVMEEKSI